MSNFIVFSLARWSVDYGCNIKDICLELSKQHRVLYIDVPLKRKDRLLKTKRYDVIEVNERIKSNNQLIQLSENLWHYIDDSVLESVNGISNVLLFDFLVKVNNKRFARAIDRAANAVGFDQYVLINDNNIYDGLYLKQILNPVQYVYYLRDNLPAMAYWKKHTGRIQPEVISNSDVVLTNSTYLRDYARQWNTKSYYVGQGCDVTCFLNYKKDESSEPVLKIKKPIVGYIGALNAERLSIDLLISVVKALPEFNFVLVGKEDSGFQKSQLHLLQNVIFTGPKDFSELPALLHYFDVAINPQEINDITVGNYPRKIDEYLAAGKPVVATKTITMEAFADHVYLGETVEDYVTLIRKALLENNDEKVRGRKNFASMHTWKNSVDEMLRYIK